MVLRVYVDDSGRGNRPVLVTLSVSLSLLLDATLSATCKPWIVTVTVHRQAMIIAFNSFFMYTCLIAPNHDVLWAECASISWSRDGGRSGQTDQHAYECVFSGIRHLNPQKHSTARRRRSRLYRAFDPSLKSSWCKPCCPHSGARPTTPFARAFHLRARFRRSQPT
jgi:hypothetical protein